MAAHSTGCGRAPAQVGLLADREHRLDRIDLRDRRQLRRRIHQVADLGDGDAGDARDRRGHLGPAEIELGLLDLRLRRVHRRQVGLVGLHRVVELLLADRALLGQRRVAGDVELGLHQIRLRLLQGAAPLVELRLELARVDLEQQLPALHHRPFLVGLGQQVALHLRTDDGVDVAAEGADPLLEDRHVLLHDLHHLHVHRRRRLGLLAGLAAAAERQQRDDGERAFHASSIRRSDDIRRDRPPRRQAHRTSCLHGTVN